MPANIQESLNETLEGLKAMHKERQQQLDVLQEKIERLDRAIKNTMELKLALEEIDTE